MVRLGGPCINLDRALQCDHQEFDSLVFHWKQSRSVFQSPVAHSGSVLYSYEKQTVPILLFSMMSELSRMPILSISIRDPDKTPLHLQKSFSLLTPISANTENTNWHGAAMFAEMNLFGNMRCQRGSWVTETGNFNFFEKHFLTKVCYWSFDLKWFTYQLYSECIPPDHQPWSSPASSPPLGHCAVFCFSAMTNSTHVACFSSLHTTARRLTC